MTITDPDKFWPRGGAGQGLEGLASHTGDHVIILCFSAKRHPIKRCAVGRHALAKAGAMMFFSYLSFNNFSRLGGKPFQPTQTHTHMHNPLLSPRRTPEVNYFSDYGRIESYIDLQYTAVWRHFQPASQPRSSRKRKAKTRRGSSYCHIVITLRSSRGSAKK